MRGACLWRCIVEEAIDPGLASTPNGRHASRDVYPYGANKTRVRAIQRVEQTEGVRVTRGVGPLEPPTIAAVLDVVIDVMED